MAVCLCCRSSVGNGDDGSNAIILWHGRSSRLWDGRAHGSRSRPRIKGLADKSGRPAWTPALYRVRLGKVLGCRSIASFPSCRRGRSRRPHASHCRKSVRNWWRTARRAVRDFGRTLAAVGSDCAAVAGEPAISGLGQPGSNPPAPHSTVADQLFLPGQDNVTSPADADDAGAADGDFGAASRGPARNGSGQVVASAVPPDDDRLPRARNPPARSSSIPRTPTSIWCSATARPCATASASAAKASPGPAPRR